MLVGTAATIAARALPWRNPSRSGPTRCNEILLLPKGESMAMIGEANPRRWSEGSRGVAEHVAWKLIQQ